MWAELCLRTTSNSELSAKVSPTFRFGFGRALTSSISSEQGLDDRSRPPATAGDGALAQHAAFAGAARAHHIAVGGRTGSTSNTTLQVTHTDQQASAIDPFNPNKLYLGNDGGFYVYDLANGNWTFFDNNQNATISSGQIQAIGPHPTDNAKLLAGFQDNGTQLYTGTLGDGEDRGRRIRAV